MRKLTVCLCVVMVLGTMAAAQAADSFATCRVLSIEYRGDSLSLLVEALGPNPQHLGKFQANVFEFTKISRTVMCQPPEPATMADIEVGHMLSITFAGVIETVGLQVDCKTVKIMGFPFGMGSDGASSSPRAPASNDHPTKVSKGTIVDVEIPPNITADHVGMGGILIEKASGEQLVLLVGKKTSIFIPGPDFGSVPLAKLEIGWPCTATHSDAVSEMYPPTVVKAFAIFAGFKDE